MSKNVLSSEDKYLQTKTNKLLWHSDSGAIGCRIAQGSGVVSRTADKEGERCVDSLLGTYGSYECRVHVHAIPGTILSLMAIGK